jgi:hypothetical protein
MKFKKHVNILNFLNVNKFSILDYRLNSFYYIPLLKWNILDLKKNKDIRFKYLNLYEIIMNWNLFNLNIKMNLNTFYFHVDTYIDYPLKFWLYKKKFKRIAKLTKVKLNNKLSKLYLIKSNILFFKKWLVLQSSKFTIKNKVNKLKTKFILNKNIDIISLLNRTKKYLRSIAYYKQKQHSSILYWKRYLNYIFNYYFLFNSRKMLDLKLFDILYINNYLLENIKHKLFQFPIATSSINLLISKKLYVYQTIFHIQFYLSIKLLLLHNDFSLLKNYHLLYLLINNCLYKNDLFFVNITKKINFGSHEKILNAVYLLLENNSTWKKWNARYLIKTNNTFLFKSFMLLNNINDDFFSSAFLVSNFHFQLLTKNAELFNPKWILYNYFILKQNKSFFSSENLKMTFQLSLLELKSHFQIFTKNIKKKIVNYLWVYKLNYYILNIYLNKSFIYASFQQILQFILILCTTRLITYEDNHILTFNYTSIQLIQTYLQYLKKSYELTIINPTNKFYETINTNVNAFSVISKIYSFYKNYIRLYKIRLQLMNSYYYTYFKKKKRLLRKHINNILVLKKKLKNINNYKQYYDRQYIVDFQKEYFVLNVDYPKVIIRMNRQNCFITICNYDNTVIKNFSIESLDFKKN